MNTLSLAKITLVTAGFILALLPLNAQDIEGAWEHIETDDSGKRIRNVVIFSDGFQVSTRFEAESGAFIGTNGGRYRLNGSTLVETVEFDTQDSTRVGENVMVGIAIDDGALTVSKTGESWNRIDAGAPGALEGAWLMSGRKRDGEIRKRNTNRSRKTMKILSGTRFQWIAYDTETKRFMGSGGGTYTTVAGKYTENIEFFSRDGSRVGASLGFDFSLQDGAWHHSGLSSKGNPIYEIWEKRVDLEKAAE